MHFTVISWLFNSFIISEASTEILGCGGFVKSDVGIKYSKVEIKLYTKQGSLKYQTDCAPNNGYYFIPLYDKGDYVLKVEPPSGWSFEPMSISLHVDGSTDACSLSHDINFVFKGFFVSGKIVSLGSTEGPTSVQLCLLNENGKVVKETYSETGGQYSFTQVLPGNYLIEAKHSTWKLENAKIPIVISQDNEAVKTDVVVSGYDVAGEVRSEGEPIRGVHFLLFARGSPKPVWDVWGCKRDVVAGFTTRDKDCTYLCHVTSGEDGWFSFAALPTGDYKLIPFYKGEHIEFDVSPSFLNFAVKHGSIVFSEKFQVQGFSVSGKVRMSTSGSAIPEAKIFLDDKHRATTNANGVYHLENMKTGSYKLQVVTASVYFDPIVVKITPNTPHLPDILASKFDVCGRLRTLNDDLSPAGRTILLSSGEKASKSLTTNKDGEFCVDLPRGEYILTPHISDTETTLGLKFVPLEKKVVVIDKPILNVLFHQFSAKASGKIDCLKNCDELQLHLEPSTKNGDGFDVISVVKGKFVIDNLLPGTYYLTVNKPEWCWKKNSIEFTITNADISNLLLQHVGYNVPIASSHALELEVQPPSGGKKFILKVETGTSAHCLPTSGIYTLRPLGCHTFQEPTINFDTSSGGVVSLVAEKHTITGKVLMEQNISDVIMTVRKNLKDGGVDVEKIHLSKKPVKEGKFFKHTFSVLSHPYSTLTFEPSSNRLLFRPSVQDLNVQDECIDDAVSFTGREGLFIHGSINPILTGVKISVVHVQDVNGSRTVAETETDSSGKYVVGPLDNELQYEVIAEKEGHVFEKTTKTGYFKALKLAEVSVDVVSDEKEPLSGVLVSLSGGTDYRKNLVTQKEGHLQFIGLSPGQYFLRPMMKEYQFDPPSKMTTVSEGATVKVTIRGKRVAFSCFGVVNSLTGEAEAGLIIEAVGFGSETCKQYQEESISEQDGTYRIRALQPECEYYIRLKEGVEENSHVERVSPSKRHVKVANGDVTNVRLIVFRYFKQTDVSGYVITSQDYMNTLKVRLFRDDSPDQALHTLSLGQSNFFHLPILPLDNKNYLLKLDTTLSSSTYNFDLPSVSFKANTTYRHFTFEFNPQPRSADPEMTQGSLLVLPLVLVISLLVFNYNKVLPLFGQLMDLLQAVINPARNINNGDTTNGGDSQSARRKTKPRRIQ